MSGVLKPMGKYLPTNLGGKYTACVNHNLRQAFEDLGETPGLISTGSHFIFQVEPGTIYDLAWAVDQFTDFEERHLVWRETDGWAVLTMVNPKCEGPSPRMVRLKVHLTPQDHTIAQTFLQEAANTEWADADQ